MPLVLPKPASEPKKELLLAVFAFPAFLPKNELFPPEAVTSPAPCPKKELLPPIPFAAPAFTPAKTFREKLETVNARLPAMLYCVVALTAFAASVPPAVPSPEMLKLLEACGEVVF